MTYSIIKNKDGKYDVNDFMGIRYNEHDSFEDAEVEKNMLEMVDSTKSKMNCCINNILAMLGQDEYEYLKDYLGGTFEVKL